MTRSALVTDFDESASFLGLGGFLFQVRESTLPGVIQVNGFLSSYPGHTIPAVRQRLQMGFRESHTNLRRRHSQQCLFSASMVGGR